MAKIMTRDEFDKFITDTYEKVVNNPRHEVFRVDGTIVLYNRYSSKSGMARCHDEDVFDSKYGVVLAYCRLKGIEFPKVKAVQQVRVDTLKNGDVFEYSGTKYIFLAKHPTLRTMCYIITPTSNNARTIRSSSVVKIETTE